MLATGLKITTLLSLTLASGCTTNGRAEFCAGWRPIYLESASILSMSEQDADSVLSHNEFGQSIGCW